MRIIKYRKLKSNKYEVYLENDEKLILYEDVILKEELLLKKEINDINTILKINSSYEIYDVALKYLNHRVISIYDMKEYLSKKQYSQNDIENTINKLIEKGYLNDSYYVKCYINDHVNLSSDGPKRIKKHLEERNILSNIYSEHLDKYQDIWYDRIKKYVEKQKKVNKKSLCFFKSKMLINLINLGYEKEMINDVLNTISIDNIDELKELEKNKIQRKLEKKYTGEELERKIKEKLWQKGFYDN